jgi:hypothetical protein
MTYTAHEIHGGYYETYKCVEVANRLRYMPYAQAGWLREKEDDYFTMVSYSSRIFTAHITASGVDEISTRNADAAMNYSRTTSRQVTMAMQELGLSGSEIVALKRFFTRGGKVAMISGNAWVNAETGEVIC